MKVLFSVIIPAYNRANMISDTIRSFLNQQNADFELLIIDDGSTDNTEEVVKSIRDDRIFYFKKNNGERGAARNYGLSKAKGQYVTFFDSDDIVFPFYLAHAARQLEALEWPACYAQAFEIAPPGSPIPTEEDAAEENIILINKRLIRSNILACNGVFVRKDITGKFKFSENRDLSGSEDWYLWAKLGANFPFYYSKKVCSRLVNHPGRGELNLKAMPVYRRLMTLVKNFWEDPDIQRYEIRDLKKIRASACLFAGLKLAYYRKFKFKSIQYLSKALWIDPAVIKRRAAYVAIKKWITTWD